MSITEYTTGVQPDTFSADDQYSKLQGTRDGAIWTADWVLAKCAEGRAFVANAGTVTSPITFGAGTIDTTEHDLFISVPSGTTIGILSVDVFLEVVGTNAILEGMAISGTGGASGAGSSITPKNLRSDAPFTSNCTITAAATASSGTAITGVEFFRFGYNKIETVTSAGDSGGTLSRSFTWNHKEAGYMPILVGTAQLGVYCGSQAGQGFITVTYVEIPSTRIT
jgi:hypothetical protein